MREKIRDVPEIRIWFQAAAAAARERVPDRRYEVT